ncbi:hypothetical protein GTQ43_23890 [Nostoc sp. KVJ3]|uniref:hypothetical protein n=1 Tax=Nostoc sp. KVJ3 TaxID=457945 RepID=UPI00223729DC|nr:hypothetical protein [Nostoc sp. KVJ3]MCW5316745.1 hypothetical protein [Nostoc sp. KVJ3]
MAILEQLQAWHELAQQLWIDSIRATAAGSSYPTSSISLCCPCDQSHNLSRESIKGIIFNELPK